MIVAFLSPITFVDEYGQAHIPTISSVSAKETGTTTPQDSGPQEEETQFDIGVPNVKMSCGPLQFVCIIVSGLYSLSTYLLTFVGYVFNIALAFTLDTGCTNDKGTEVCTILASQDINNLWSNIKDLANLGFIVGLIYISMSLITGFNSAQAKGLFIKVVIAAIVINFSLLGTKIMIDAGNITARAFYDQLVINPAGSKSDDKVKQEDLQNALKSTQKQEVKDISGAILASFNPQRIFSSKAFADFLDEKNSNAFKRQILTFIFFISMMMNGFIAASLLTAAFTFVSRIVWLVLLSVVSPLVVVSTFLPTGKNLFDKWLSMLIDRCFCVVVYVFFIWLLVLISSSLTSDSSNTPGTWEGIMTLVLVQFIAIYAIIKIATDQTKKMCEGGLGLGTFTAGMVNKLPGLIPGTALGLAGAGLRSTVGVGALNLAEGKGVFGGESNFLGKFLERKAAEGGAASTFARSQLRNLADVTWGTNTGAFDKRESGVKKWQAQQQTMEASRIEILSKKAKTDFVENANNDNKVAEEHEIILNEYKAEQKRKGKSDQDIESDVNANRKDIISNGYATTVRAGDDKTRIENETTAKVTEMQRKQVKGVGGVIDFMVNRGVSTANEAARRREDQINSDEQTEIGKRTKERIAREKKAKIQLKAEEISRTTARSTSEILQEFDENWDDIQGNVAEQVQKVSSSAQGLLSGLSGEVKKQYQVLEVETIKSIETANKDLREFREELEAKKSKDMEPFVENARTIQNRMDSLQDPEKKHLEYDSRIQIMQDIQQEILSGGSAQITEGRKALLASYGFDTSAETLTSQQSSSISDIKATLINDRNTAEATYAKELERVKNTRDEAQKELSTIQKNIEERVKEYNKKLEAVEKESAEEVKGIMKNYEKTLKERATTLIEEKQARLVSDQIQENVTGETGEREKLKSREEVNVQAIRSR